MSASREKQTRQAQASSGWTDPKTLREAEQRKKEKRSSILYGVIAVVFLLVAAACIVWKSNVIEKTATAATIDGEKYTAAEVNYYYNTVVNNFYNNNYYYMMMGYISLNAQADPATQTMTEADAAMLSIELEEGQTWKDYFVDATLNQMAAVKSVLAEAEAEGFTYPDSVQADYDARMESLKTTAAANNMSVSQYLKAAMGAGMTQKIYGQQLMRALQYTAYAQAHEDSLTYDNAALETAYNEDTRVYDKAAYEYVSISGTAPSTTDAEGNEADPTEEEQAAAKEAAKAAADKLLADFRAGGDLEALAGANEDYSYNNVENGTYTSSALQEWVFNDARKAGDSAVVESGSTYYVVAFHDRFRDEYSTVAVRHILLTVDDSALDTESDTYETDLQALKDETKAQAEELLAQWKAGDATEDSFAALANEKSADSGSNTNGGLYSQFPKNYMVPEFNDWCFDVSRKPGDTGIVYGESTNYKGYHVMYFVGDDLPYWQVQVSDALKEEAMNEWYNSYGEGHTIEKGSGIKYVG